MVLQSKPRKSDKAADSFIQGAPDSDAKGSAPGLRRGRKRQITLTITDELLEGVDRLARERGISRASAFSLAAYEWIQRERDSSSSG